MWLRVERMNARLRMIGDGEEPVQTLPAIPLLSNGANAATVRRLARAAMREER
jgi:hypothetical protein